MQHDRLFERGLKNCISDFCGVGNEDRVLIVFGAEVQKPLTERITRLAGDWASEIMTFSAEGDWGPIGQKADWANVLIFFEGSQSSFREGVDNLPRELVARSYRVFGTTEELFQRGFQMSLLDTLAVNNAVIARLSKGGRLLVSDDLGSNLEIELESERGWINSYGKAGNKPGVLPPSEVATFSEKVDGVLIVDGALNSNFGLPFSARLAGRKVELKISNGRLASFHTDDPLLGLFLKSYFSSDQARQVGEIGFGTNLGLGGFTDANAHINERFPSLHLGFGSHNQGRALSWSFDRHLDFITRGVRMSIDGDTFFADGQYRGLSGAEPIDSVDIGWADTY